MIRIARSVSCASALTSLAFACASAYAGVTVTPPGPTGKPIPFAARGATTLSKGGASISCNSVFTGQISGSGEVKFTGASFTGPALCKTIVPKFSNRDAYWSGNIANKTALTLDGVEIEVKLLGTSCGPSAINATISQSPADQETVIALSDQKLSNGCAVSGSLMTTPYLRVTD